MKYFPFKLEKKWQKKWLNEKTHEPDLGRAKKPFYNLMMFPYPSAEGLHVGNMYAFTGADIYGRFKRMRGGDVFEPIGLDGFGIHSENYAFKTGKHPAKQAKISEKNFYRQLLMLGNGFAWNERLETYDPAYYRWTQWIFARMFKCGLAYRKKAPVNWCPGCKTVLADEQAAGGECERCGSAVVKKELEQWFFKITAYAERLLKNLDGIDWSEKIKIAQRNWIGKSEGFEINFEIRTEKKPNFVLLHGYKGSPEKNFFPRLKSELENRGYKVQIPRLPFPDNPNVAEQTAYVLKNTMFDEQTVVLGHSLGSVVAMKAVESLARPVAKLVLAAGFMRPPSSRGKKRGYEKTFAWKFDAVKIKRNAGKIAILRDAADDVVPADEADFLKENFGGEIFDFKAEAGHICGKNEPEVLRRVLDSFAVFTTRPDTLFGATYAVLAPEHRLVADYKAQIANYKEAEEYIKKAKAKTEEERIAEGMEKTGVELKGIKAVNPATGEEIPIWLADYVLGRVGTGAIMAVPAHDQRDFAFAQKYVLPAKMVVCPNWPEKTCPVLERAYEGKGHLVGSGKFDGTPSEKAKEEITKFVGGRKTVRYRLRDWLISRQRYWGPPIPMLFCGACGLAGRGERGEMPGWYAAPDKDLPVKLPYLKNFRPTGTDKSPLALAEKFYKVRCPKCGFWARRETDVSDTFLDSAWYYIGYLAKKNSEFSILDSEFRRRAERWLPVDMYIGGAEHAVLHLLYVRFLAMAFYDMNLLRFEEPFKKFRSHGLLIKDGTKMSKSRGNVVNPDEYIRFFGADALRMYLMFLGPFEQGGDFRDTGIKGITRFLERVWRFGHLKMKTRANKGELLKKLHKTVKKATDDIESLQHNTAISALMVFLNEFEKSAEEASSEHFKIFLKLLAPFAPHISEELYQKLFAASGKFRSVHREPWPEYDSALVKEKTFELAVQINGRMRGRIEIPFDAGEEEAKRAALSLDNVKRYLSGKTAKVFFVKNRLINFAV